MLTGELERAAGPPRWSQHGLDAMGARAVGRDLEAQTSLKRGALNLRHAQEAFARTARETWPRCGPRTSPSGDAGPDAAGSGPVDLGRRAARTTSRAASTPACSGILAPHHKG